MSRLTIFCLLLFICIASINFSQETDKRHTIDSLFQAYSSMTDKQKESFHSQADSYLKKFEFEEQLVILNSVLESSIGNSKEIKYRTHRLLSSTYWKMNNLQKAQEHARLMMRNSFDLDSKLLSHSVICNRFYYSEQFDSTLYYANQLDELAPKSHELRWKAYEYRAWTFAQLGEKEKFKAEVDKGMDYFKNFPGGHSQYGYFLYRVADHFFQADDQEGFNQYSEELFTYFGNKSSVVPKGHVPIDYLMFSDGPEKAITLLNETIQYNRNKPLVLASLTHYLAKAYGKANQPEKGITLLNDFLINDPNNLSLKNKASMNWTLSELYEQKGDYKLATNALRSFNDHNTLYQERIKEQEVAKLEIEFDTKQKENELALSQLKLKKVHRERLVLIAGLVGLISLAGLLYRLIQQRKKVNEKLADKNRIISYALAEKDLLLREIHHRVKNNLQVVSSLLNLQSRQVEDDLAKQVMQEGRNRVHSMALIHQNLYQDENLMGVNAKDYIEKLSNSLLSNYQIDDKQIDVITSIDDVNLDVDMMIPLGLILNELLTNSLKYAFEDQEIGEIEISLKNQKENLHLTVSDNGKGIPEGFDLSQSSSLGYRLIQSFAKKLKAKLEINHQNGTAITMIIPQQSVA